MPSKRNSNKPKNSRRFPNKTLVTMSNASTRKNRAIDGGFASVPMMSLRTRALLAQKSNFQIFVSQRYTLTASAGTLPAGANCFYRKYLRFNPGATEVFTPTTGGPLVLAMDNNTGAATSVTTLNCISDSEYTSWAQLYSKARLNMVSVHYTPSVTMGVSSSTAQFSGATTLIHGPILTDLDSVMSSAGALVVPPTIQSEGKLLLRPGMKSSSTYKPFTHSFSPVFYRLETGPTVGSTSGFVRPVPSPFVDLEETFTGANLDILDGFIICMPPISFGGQNVPTDVFFPTALNDTYTLGVLEFSYLIEFKDRQ